MGPGKPGCSSRLSHLSLSHHPFPSSVRLFKLLSCKSLGLYPPWLHVGFAKSFHISKLLESLLLTSFFCFLPYFSLYALPCCDLLLTFLQKVTQLFVFLSFFSLGNAKFCLKNHQKLQAQLLRSCRLTVMGPGFVCWGQAVPHSALSVPWGVTGRSGHFVAPLGAGFGLSRDFPSCGLTVLCSPFQRGGHCH